MRGLSPVAASGGHSSSRCAGLSLSRPLLLQSTGSRRAGSVVVAHGPSCSAACGIFPDQRSNPCPLHRQADSQPLRHQGSPILLFLMPLKMELVSTPRPATSASLGNLVEMQILGTHGRKKRKESGTDLFISFPVSLLLVNRNTADFQVHFVSCY